MSVVGPSQFWVAGRQVPEPVLDNWRVAPVFQHLLQHFQDLRWLPEETVCLSSALAHSLCILSGRAAVAAQPVQYDPGNAGPPVG